MTLFGRQAVVTVGGLRVEGLSIRFNVSVDDGNLGKAEIAVYNLNSAHRKQIESLDEIDVTLLAGYVGSELGLLFRGTIRQGSSVKDPPNWITTLRAGDGDKAAKARINRSYSPGTKFETMWKDTTKAIEGIGIGNALEMFSRGEYKDGIKEIFRGGTLQGSALKELRRLARGADLDVMIQDQELVVTEIGKPLGATAVLLTPTTGLISSPQKGPKGVLKVRALLIPGLKPKRKVEIRSSLVSGLYVVKKAQYKGDTRGNDWYADLECVAL